MIFCTHNLVPVYYRPHTHTNGRRKDKRERRTHNMRAVIYLDICTLPPLTPSVFVSAQRPSERHKRTQPTQTHPKPSACFLFSSLLSVFRLSVFHSHASLTPVVLPFRLSLHQHRNTHTPLLLSFSVLTTPPPPPPTHPLRSPTPPTHRVDRMTVGILFLSFSRQNAVSFSQFLSPPHPPPLTRPCSIVMRTVASHRPSELVTLFPPPPPPPPFHHWLRLSSKREGASTRSRCTPLPVRRKKPKKTTKNQNTMKKCQRVFVSRQKGKIPPQPPSPPPPHTHPQMYPATCLLL